MALVWKFKRGEIWYLFYAAELGGGRRSTKTRNAREAEAIRMDEEHRAKSDRAGGAGRSRRILFIDFVLEYMTHKINQGRAENTIVAVKSALHNFGEFAGNVPLSSISADALERFAAHRRDAGKSEKTIRNELGILRTAFRWAMKKSRSYLRENPADEIDLPKIQRLPARTIEDRDLAKVLLKVHEAGKVEFYDMLLMYRYTGMRRAELLLLSPAHIDEGNQILTIVEPKTKSYRTLEIVPALRRVLDRLLLRHDGSGPFFRIDEDTISKTWNEYRDLAELDPRLTLHKLRGTWATEFLLKGGTLPELMAAGGWRSIEAVQKYIRPKSEGIRKKLARGVSFELEDARALQEVSGVQAASQIGGLLDLAGRRN